MNRNALISLIAVLVAGAVVRSDNFPSLITSNATLAVIIDRDYLGDDFERVKNAIETYLVYAKREILKHGGINVQFFTWASVRIKKEITAIVSVASCIDTWRIFQMARDQSLLHVAVSESDCPRLPSDEAITVTLVRNGDEVSQIVLDLRSVVAYRWRSATIIFDHTLNRDSIPKLFGSFTKDYGSVSTAASTAVSLVKIETNSTASRNRANIVDSLAGFNAKTMGRNFVAVVSSENMEIVMELAKSRGFVDVRNQWLYVVSDANANGASDLSKVKRLLREGDNISFMYNATVEAASCRSGLECYLEELLEAFCQSLDAAIVEEFDLSSLVSDEEWEAIRPTKSERRDSLLSNIKARISTRGSCGNCTKWKFQAGDTWGREYVEGKSTPADLIDVGTWRPSDGCTLKDVLFPHVAHGFRGRTLPMITYHNPPWQILTVNETGNVVRAGGLAFDVIDEISKSLNFTYKVIVATNASTGSGGGAFLPESSTGTIPDHVVGMIRRKNVAMTAAVYTVTVRGKEIVNFTMPIDTQIYTFLVARPKELSRALLFMSPFKGYAWLCISMIVICMGPILFFVDRLSPVYKYKGVSTKGGLSSIQNCIWYMYGALLQQGGMHLPGADSSRIIVGSWWLVVLVITTTYCGNLVAFLTFPKIDVPLRTIEDILHHRDTITWSIAKNSYFQTELQVTAEPKYKALRDGSTAVKLEEDAMLSDIENGKHVYIDWKLNLQMLMERQYDITKKCDLSLGAEEFFEEQLSFVVSQDTPYLEIINDEIKRLHQMGLIFKWVSNYLPKRNPCFKGKSHEANNHTVNLDDMQGSFFVLFIGFAASLLTMIGERALFNYKLKHRKNVIAYTS